MSELHERLEEAFKKKGVYAPYTFIYDFLKDVTVETMVRLIVMIEILLTTGFLLAGTKTYLFYPFEGMYKFQFLH